MILMLWRDVRETYHDAVRMWIDRDIEMAIFFLRLAVERTETLIVALEKGVGNGKNSNH